jgi:predicted GNAT superfamily acetyltransferase
MYDQFAYAYWELYQNAPNSHLDLHHGNIGFTYSGTLKVFDIQ